MKLYFTSILLFLTSFISAQNTGSFSGQVIDEITQEPLEGASILLEGTTLGVITDQNGFFSFDDVPTKTYNVNATFLGIRISNII